MQYTLLYSFRKTLALEIRPNGELLIRAPHGYSKRRIEQFILEKEAWIQKSLARRCRYLEEQGRAVPDMTVSEQKKLHKRAVELFHNKAEYYANQMGVAYNRIFVKGQKTRFGSCSSKKNLNFNRCLLFAPEEVLDYVVVHELAHLKEMNHSPAFWSIVEQEMPDYKVRRKWLKDYGHTLR